jgi:hypothetical protein
VSRKKSGTKTSKTLYDLLIKAKVSLTSIEDVGSDSVEIKNHVRGKVSGRYYSGAHIDTTEGTMMMDGSMQFNVKFIHFTSKGEMVVGQGAASQDPVDRSGKAMFSGEATTWTRSTRLSSLNGARWQFDGTYNSSGESIEARCTLVEKGRPQGTEDESSSQSS